MDIGPLLGQGRTADVYALDDGRVLRRVRTGVDVTADAAALRHVVGHGYPAPALHEVRGQDMVMDRVDGPTMLAALLGGQLAMSEAAAMIADLLRRLHALPPRPGAGPGTRLVHLDLHPDNVILGAAGPVVIDWTNARDEAPALDTAFSALILAQVAADTGQPAAAPAGELLALILGHPLGHPLGDVLDELPRAAAARAVNPTMTAREVAVIPSAVALVRSLVGRGST